MFDDAIISYLEGDKPTIGIREANGYGLRIISMFTGNHGKAIETATRGHLDPALHLDFVYDHPGAFYESLRIYIAEKKNLIWYFRRLITPRIRQ